MKMDSGCIGRAIIPGAAHFPYRKMIDATIGRSGIVATASQYSQRSVRAQASIIGSRVAYATGSTGGQRGF
ncbi:hypothetical protein NPS29_22400 [Pseudomonas putida]|uniref:hypothetical protein n=1 Tax=Pseudomonas putida TaxID=303 RepID=UPI0023639206|nr:hypothetical protein [Pseudomonas putida]MDD1968080.1 hypothetical protein [Pseudomonas putida]